MRRIRISAVAAVAGLLAVAGPAAADQAVVPLKALPPGVEYTKADEAFAIKVDDALRPEAKGDSAFAGPNSPAAEFVTGELIVNGDAKSAAGLAERLGGKLVATVSPGDLPGLAPYGLVRFEPGDPSGAEKALAALSPDIAHGTQRVSDPAGLATIAAAAQARLDGVAADLNWIGAPDTIRTRSTREAPGQDAFAWSPLNDIRVPAAWNTLARAGRLGTGSAPRLAVLDVGFSPPDADRAPGGNSVASVANTISCGGFACPFHGSDVASVMFGVPDNSFGGAGAAGPVNVPMLYDRGASFFTEIPKRIQAAADGARVINMSFGAPIPAILYPLVSGYDALSASLRAAGVLQVAAAGNSGLDIDSVSCFVVCWEDAYVAPCESVGVLCVGGLTGTVPSGGSNFGRGGLDPAGTVELWAPMCALAGPSPTSPGNAVHISCGTSIASPLASGALGLLFAARAGVSGNLAESTLLATASPGGCLPGGRCAPRIVDASAGVNALIGNLPPDVSISAPATATVARGTARTFVASASDPEGAALTVRWFVDGVQTATGPTYTDRFYGQGFGTHRITATVSDGLWSVGDAAGGVTVTLTNTAPTVRIDTPTAGQTFAPPALRERCLREWGTFELICPSDIVLQATSADANNASGTLADADLRWFVDGNQVATGHSARFRRTAFGTGPHTVIVTGTDGQFSVAASVAISVS